MRFIRFVQLGPSNNVLICNLVSTLNSVQSEFRFAFESRDVFPYPTCVQEGESCAPLLLEQVVEQHALGRPGEYLVGICDCRLAENVLTSSDSRKALITTSGWGLSSEECPTLKLVAFGLVDILLESLGVETPTHYEAKACPMDYRFDDPNALPEKLSKADFCGECRTLLRVAAAQDRITIQEIAAIYKILDYIAGRKVCFVLMPFHNRFDSIYQKGIRPTLEARGWECSRADEIHQTTEIISLIWEQILRADLIVADLTGRNPNVFYELGYAHALGKNTILIGYFPHGVGR